jgi:hypothetical protein
MILFGLTAEVLQISSILRQPFLGHSRRIRLAIGSRYFDSAP